MTFDRSIPNWSVAIDLGAPQTEVGEQYSVKVPKGFTYTVCKPGIADGATGLPQRVRREWK